MLQKKNIETSNWVDKLFLVSVGSWPILDDFYHQFFQALWFLLNILINFKLGDFIVIESNLIFIHDYSDVSVEKGSFF